MSRMVVYKYPLKITDEQWVKTGGKNARPLSVGEQDGRLVMWVALEPDADNDERELFVRIIGTGNPAGPIDGQFIGTVQMKNGLVWHVFVK